jgi:formylglycine-generating enzyme required for sulfatase activity
MRTFFKTVAVIVIAAVLSTLTINAGDNFGDFSNSFLASVVPGLAQDPCPKDMTFVATEMGGFCIDVYEASAGEDCLFETPQNEDETQQNIGVSGCMAVSEEGREPWTYIPQHQAVLACAHAGKRLPTLQEWYRASLGTPDAGGGVCNTHNSRESRADLTGEFALCVSARGAYDMIGNVWEWVDATVVDGEFEEITLPAQGFVAAVNTEGVPTQTMDTPNLSFNGDYFWRLAEGTQGVFRGGYWGLEGKAGLYAFHAGVPATFIGNGVGFRCAQ